MEESHEFKQIRQNIRDLVLNRIGQIKDNHKLDDKLDGLYSKWCNMHHYYSNNFKTYSDFDSKATLNDKFEFNRWCIEQLNERNNHQNYIEEMYREWRKDHPEYYETLDELYDKGTHEEYLRFSKWMQLVYSTISGEEKTDEDVKIVDNIEIANIEYPELDGDIHLLGDIEENHEMQVSYNWYDSLLYMEFRRRIEMDLGMDNSYNSPFADLNMYDKSTIYVIEKLINLKAMEFIKDIMDKLGGYDEKVRRKIHKFLGTDMILKIDRYHAVILTVYACILIKDWMEHSKKEFEATGKFSDIIREYENIRYIDVYDIEEEKVDNIQKLIGQSDKVDKDLYERILGIEIDDDKNFNSFMFKYTVNDLIYQFMDCDNVKNRDAKDLIVNMVIKGNSGGRFVWNMISGK